MSVQLEAERIRNTYHYALTSDDAEGRDEIGEFDFLIPPFPFPEHNSAQRCIFTLEGFVIGDQIVNQQIGATSYLSVDIAGLGMSAQNYNSTNNVAGAGVTLIKPSNRFLIPNVYEEFSSESTARAGGPSAGDVFDNVPIQRMTGNFDMTNPYVLLCSNPVGKQINFKVFNDAGAQIGANGNLNAIIKFKIELIPDS